MYIEKSRKSQIKSDIAKVVIGVIVLLILSVIVGIGYTWYSGKYGKTTKPAVKAEEQDRIVHTEPRPPVLTPNAPVGVSIQLLSSPIAPGEEATVTIRTTPMAECTIVVEYDKQKSTNPRLEPKIADDFGTVSWRWTVGQHRPYGVWPVTVTCKRDDKSGMVRGDLELKRKEDLR